jgi:hypothetical protein
MHRTGYLASLIACCSAFDSLCIQHVYIWPRRPASVVGSGSDPDAAGEDAGLRGFGWTLALSGSFLNADALTVPSGGIGRERLDVAGVVAARACDVSVEVFAAVTA